MTNFRLPRSLCAIIGSVLPGSHATLESLFLQAGAPGPPPLGPHSARWKEWLFRIGTEPGIDTLSVLGNILEEFMDTPPLDGNPESLQRWQTNRDRVVNALEQTGLRYYRGGRVLPTGQTPEEAPAIAAAVTHDHISRPSQIDELLEILIKGLRRAMHPLTHRRKGAQPLSFSTEYDVQDLLHALLRPWVSDIRPEEFTPSYAGSSTRMDFLLPKYDTVIELKFVRDKIHAKKIGDELIIDIDHYQAHPKCAHLWCVVFDPDHLLTNAEGLKTDLSGTRSGPGGSLTVKVRVL